MIRLYKLAFGGDTLDLDILYNEIPEYEKDRLDNVDILASFDFEDEEGYYNCYLLTTDTEIEIYKNILETNFILYICTDISVSVINNQFDLESYIKNRMDLLEYVNYYIFIDEVNNWIFKNLTMDGILDRISLHGIENLRKADYRFLNQI